MQFHTIGEEMTGIFRSDKKAGVLPVVLAGAKMLTRVVVRSTSPPGKYDASFKSYLPAKTSKGNRPEMSM